MSTSTWSKQAANGEWNDADNWSSGVPTDTAYFGESYQTGITFSATGNATVNKIEFTADAYGYTLNFDTSTTPELTIAGDGVVNHSGQWQRFIVAATSAGYTTPQLVFGNSASAGSHDLQYRAGPVSKEGYGGGVIRFVDSSTAGSASFEAWTGAEPPPKGVNSTVGGEISFADTASAATARFTVYGTLGTDGDTFGNAVFHDSSTADHATFYNAGGTVYQGDGGNTQFYDTSTAANATFNNQGGTHDGAYGGDVAFDGTATGAQGRYYNHAATAPGASGGVTSFNNNPPEVTSGGASAGNGRYYNYGAEEGELGGGGHVELSGKHGSPTGANGTFYNYASHYSESSSAGHTILSGTSTAGDATLIAYGGTDGGAGGYIAFYDDAEGGNATIQLNGNGQLELGDHTGDVTIGTLQLNDGGVISTQLGTNTPALKVKQPLVMSTTNPLTFSFWTEKEGGFTPGTHYTLLNAPNLSGFSLEQFSGNSVEGMEPSFSFSGNDLLVTFSQS